MGNAPAKRLCFTPFLVHVMGEEVSGLAGMYYNIGFRYRAAERPALASQFEAPVEIFTDVDALLAREDIEAVDILLPIELMPEIVEKALLAGKHVLSEKPVAPTVERGRALLAVPTRGVWMVAENWRYMESFYQAAERLAQGCLLVMHMPRP